MKYFVDTNIYLYALENQTALGDKAREFFSQVQKGKIAILTSAVSIVEILTGVFKRNLADKVPLYLEFLTGGGMFPVISINQPIAVRAAQIRAQFNLRTPDALQLAAAQAAEATHFLTADKGLPAKIGNLRVKTLK